MFPPLLLRSVVSILSPPSPAAGANRPVFSGPFGPFRPDPITRHEKRTQSSRVLPGGRGTVPRSPQTPHVGRGGEYVAWRIVLQGFDELMGERMCHATLREPWKRSYAPGCRRFMKTQGTARRWTSLPSTRSNATTYWPLDFSTGTTSRPLDAICASQAGGI